MPINFAIKFGLCLILLVLNGCTAIRDATIECPPSASSSRWPQARPIHETLRDRSVEIAWPSAHRARTEHFADNSLSGIRELASLHIPLLEVDVRLNRERTALLFHDATVQCGNTLTPGTFEGRRIDSLNDQEIKIVELAGRDDEKIPTLREALEAVKPFNTLLELDLKDESPDAIAQVLDLVRATNNQARVLVQCKSTQCGKILRDKYFDIALLMRVRSPDKLAESIDLDPIVIELEKWYSPEAVSAIRKHGIRTLVNIAGSVYDRPIYWRSLFGDGVNILMTDHSTQLLRISTCSIF